LLIGGCRWEKYPIRYLREFFSVQRNAWGMSFSLSKVKVFDEAYLIEMFAFWTNTTVIKTINDLERQKIITLNDYLLKYRNNVSAPQ
jgi:hypothetical protein